MARSLKRAASSFFLKRKAELANADMDGCCAEINAFVRGEWGGLARLQRVLESLWIHFRIPVRARRKLLECLGLRPFTDTRTQRISFYMPKETTT